MYKESSIFYKLHLNKVVLLDQPKLLQLLKLLCCQKEEEHLLPEPYHTNCTDYEALWQKNNRTGPRSQERCKESCWKSYYDLCSACLLNPEEFHWPDICKTGIHSKTLKRKH
ncbi:hypothetical protein NPIL_697301 [Nephila pilipes]|uniref:Uncharacterized protein n=1 Tax=Nephila pilipes TaxID=299642 RepID=A0A8X6MYB9_NEPPI|nr:hypothetical protein NPIL_697301 [Nephila pilipes]